MNKYQKNTQRKKEAIIRAALGLFQSRGFKAVSMKEIAAAAQVSPVSIYNYFGSKEQLIEACLPLIIGDSLEEARTILKQEALPFEQKLEKALNLCTQKVNLSVSQYFTQEALDDKRFTELLAKRINKEKREIYRSYIEYGKKAHAIDSNLSTETIIDFMEGLNQVDSKQISQRKIQELHHLFLHGLLSFS
ncbi:TetR/AcrR family transcriptional regulator [Streptococcus dentiloxodontae]